MFKNTILNVVIIVLVSVTLLVGAAFVVWTFFIKDGGANPADQAADLAKKTEPKTLTADEIVALTSVLDSVTTNLADKNHYISISLAFQLENKKTHEEFEKLKSIRIQPIVLKLLHSTTPEQLFEANGFDNFASQLMNEINRILSNGKIVQIDITSFVIVDRL